ncbi:putative Diamine acetyltransferase 2 [Hypsibius exemplaris]|uniref:Diamine acetyltransferase 2 n=1 Tax=Hypsibius exemplaris TaxID=2072580 RepID=A0A1W0WVG3_HYPEX|nr:putative Diamine acetyltransferase 2 [Hypsibius exemplaris]
MDSDGPSHHGVIIRPATVTDCQGIHRLIQELAAFQGYPDGPELTVETLRRDGFPVEGDNSDRQTSTAQVFQANVVEETATGKLVGYAIFFPFYSTWKGKGIYLEDIYVQSDYRKAGVGKRLFASVCRFALEWGGSAVRLSVLKKNVQAKAFYERLGFENSTVEDGWETGRFGEETLRKIVESVVV